MSTLQEVEAAVRQLSSEDLASFRAWFLVYDADLWDRQLEEDMRAGRLDPLAVTVVREHRKRRRHSSFWVVSLGLILAIVAFWLALNWDRLGREAQKPPFGQAVQDSPPLVQLDPEWGVGSSGPPFRPPR